MMTIVDSNGLDRADTVTLLDGAVVLLRRLDAHDAEAVEGFHSDLTDRDRYYRFFVIHPRGFLHLYVEPGLMSNAGVFAIMIPPVPPPEKAVFYGALFGWHPKT